MARFFILTLAALCVGQAADAEIYNMPNSYRAPALTPISNLGRHLQNQLRDIRQKALAQRAADGGALTEAHRAAFQAQIDRVETNYLAQVRRNDPLSVSSDGSPIG